MMCFPLEVHLGMGCLFYLGKKLSLWLRLTCSTLPIPLGLLIG